MTESTSDSKPMTLDAWHSSIVDAACAADAARVAAGEPLFVRFAEQHEFCFPRFCMSWRTVVAVTSLGPGLRSRRPLPTEGAAA